MKRPTPLSDEAKILDPTPEARTSFGDAFERIIGLMARLRAENGCPWDREQDLHSLRPYLIEEAYEVLDAINHGSVDEHREELGDLLLQVIFQAEIRREQGAFDAADVAHGIADKLVRRHPHVFGEDRASDPAQALQRWEKMKTKEKNGRSALAGVPGDLPALLRAQRVSEKASNVGFDWKDVDGPMAKVEEELAELRSAMRQQDRAAIEQELGDVLFSLVNVARFLEVNAEDALRTTVDRFSRRFKHLEQVVTTRGESISDLDAEALDALWNQAKRET